MCIYLFLKYWILSNIYYHFDLRFQVSKCPVIILKPFIIIANSQAMATWYSLHYVSTLLHSASWGWAGCAWSRPGGLPMLCAQQADWPMVLCAWKRAWGGGEELRAAGFFLCLLSNLREIIFSCQTWPPPPQNVGSNICLTEFRGWNRIINVDTRGRSTVSTHALCIVAGSAGPILWRSTSFHTLPFLEGEAET